MNAGPPDPCGEHAPLVGLTDEQLDHLLGIAMAQVEAALTRLDALYQDAERGGDPPAEDPAS